MRQVFTLADVIHPGIVLILLAVFGCPRWGELAALQRTDIDLVTRTVRIERTLTELRGRGQVFGPPKSDAGSAVASDESAFFAEFEAMLQSIKFR